MRREGALEKKRVTNTEYATFDDLRANAEELPEGVETPDYTDEYIIPPGRFLSTSREVKPKAAESGKPITFELQFPTGLQNGKSTYGLGRFPERAWVSTKLYEQAGRAGKTSSVAQYLRACGINPKGMTTAQLIDAMQESQTLPVTTIIGWEERVSPDENGRWPKTKLRTKHFNKGTKENPVYVPEVEIDGVTYHARHRVVGYDEVKA